MQLNIEKAKILQKEPEPTKIIEELKQQAEQDVAIELATHIVEALLYNIQTQPTIKKRPDKNIKKQLDDLLEEFKDIQADSLKGLKPTDVIQHEIHLTSDIPVTSRAYVANAQNEKWMKQEITDMLEKGTIVHSRSNYASPVVVVDKKTGDKRLCVDYRKLNKITYRDRYPLPRIDVMLGQFAGAKIFSALDLTSGFYQIHMNPKHQHLTAFITSSGLYEFTVMPFGLCGSPGTFQRMMNYVLKDHIGKFVLVYMDDIIIYSKSPEEHMKHIRIIFEELRKYSLKIKLKKCEWCMEELPFLGHVVGKDGIKTDPKKIEKIKNLPYPTNLKELRSFMGLIGYF